MITNCVNCGAPLHGKKCEYCGTEYNNDGVYASFDRGEATGTISIGGVEYQVHIGSMEGHVLCSGAYRDANGLLHMEQPVMKHKFTLIEL
jgi:hypothetical protein